MPTFRLVQTLSGDVGAITPVIEATAESAQTFTVVLEPDAADVEVNVAFAAARLKGFVAVSTHDFVLKTKIEDEPDLTLPIAGRRGLAWLDGMNLAHPFENDVTTIFLDNANEEEENEVTFKILYDPTP